jgi:hypothetical protein
LFALGWGWGLGLGIFFILVGVTTKKKSVGPYVKKKTFENKPEQVIPRTVFNISGFLGLFGAAVSLDFVMTLRHQCLCK